MHLTLLSFALIIASGAAFGRIRPGGLHADTVRSSINALVLNLFLPALCIKAVSASEIDSDALLVPMTAWAVTLSTLLMAWLTYEYVPFISRGLSGPEKGVMIISAAFGNVTYLGLPMLRELYGEAAVRYALYYDLLATTPILWLIGAPMAARYGGAGGKGFDIRQSLHMLAALPPIWGIAIGFLISGLGLPLHPVLIRALDMLGGLVVPLMIFSIGLALRLPKVGHALHSIPASAIKLFVSPAIALAVVAALGLKGDAMRSCFVESAMPTMVLSMLIASRFKLDVPLSAFIIVITTAGSFITLPLAAYLAGGF